MADAVVEEGVNTCSAGELPAGAADGRPLGDSVSAEDL